MRTQDLMQHHVVARSGADEKAVVVGVPPLLKLMMSPSVAAVIKFSQHFFFLSRTVHVVHCRDVQAVLSLVFSFFDELGFRV